MEITDVVLVGIISAVAGVLSALAAPVIKAKLDKKKTDAELDHVEAMADSEGAVTILTLTKVVREQSQQISDMNAQIVILSGKVERLESELQRANDKLRDMRGVAQELRGIISFKDQVIDQARDVIHRLLVILKAHNLTPDFFIPLDLQVKSESKRKESK